LDGLTSCRTVKLVGACVPAKIGTERKIDEKTCRAFTCSIDMNPICFLHVSSIIIEPQSFQVATDALVLLYRPDLLNAVASKGTIFTIISQWAWDTLKKT
jgi:hypothetical protein